MTISKIVFPLPFHIHIIFVAVATLLMIFCYVKLRRKYQLYIIIGLLSTFLVYIARPKIVFYMLGIEEFILLGLAIWDMKKYEKAEKLREKAAKEQKEQAEAAAETSAEPEQQ